MHANRQTNSRKDNKSQKDLHFLLEIAKKTGLSSEIKITTGALSNEFGMSQQSISRKLAELEDKGLIYRSVSVDGIKIKLSDKGISKIKQVYSELKVLFEKQKRPCELRGKVSSGLGEGRFYTELPEYKRQFIEKLGISPFPGTLNIKVREEDKDSFTLCRIPILIDGFITKDRTYGSIKCYPGTLLGIKVAVIIPDRTIHRTGIAEIISDKYLRKALKLEDGVGVVVK
jgi:riboflavin kinase, archaea type